MHNRSSFQRPFAITNMISLALLGLYICILFFNMLGYSYWGDNLDIMIINIQDAYCTGSLYLDDFGTWFITIFFYTPAILFNIISLISSLFTLSRNRSRAIWACVLLVANILTLWGVFLLIGPFCQSAPQEGSAEMGCIVSIAPAYRGFIIPAVLAVYTVGGGCLVAAWILMVQSWRAYERWLHNVNKRCFTNPV